MSTNNLDIDVLSKELRFLLELNQTNKNTTTILPAQFDWDIFLELVFHHRLFPGLNTKMRSLMGVSVPTYVIQQLKHWKQVNLYHMLNLAAEMDYLNQLFLKNKIRALFLKGPVLGKVLYGDISLRTSSDLDVLVPICELEKVEKQLERMGYVKDDYIETILNDWKWRHHHLSYFHPKKMVKIEVHWRLNPGPGKEPHFDELWNQRQELNISQKTPIYYLGNEELFFFLVTHGSRHGWSRLRWLVDIDQLVRMPIDWHRVKRLFNSYSHLPVAGQALILANQLLHTPIEEAIQIIGLGERAWLYSVEALFYLKQMIHLHDEPLPIEVSRYHKRHLISLMSIKQKMLFYLSFLFPYPEDAETLPLPKGLHYLYFLLRPFLCIWRRQKKIMTQGVKG